MPEIYEKQQIEEDILIDILCDSCGKSCKVESSFSGGLYEFAQFIAGWGYGSRKDGDQWNFLLCEDCADRVYEFIKGEK